MNSIIEAQQEYFGQLWWAKSLIGLPVVTAPRYLPKDIRVKIHNREMEQCLKMNARIRKDCQTEIWDEKIHADFNKKPDVSNPTKETSGEEMLVNTFSKKYHANRRQTPLDQGTL